MMSHPFIHHHKRFLAAAACALLAWWPAKLFEPNVRLLVAGDVFFFVYLALVFQLARRQGPTELRARAKIEDEGIVFIVAFTIAAIVLSMASIFTLLEKGSGLDWFGLILALSSLPLGWLTLHALAAQHYANLFYARAPGEGGTADHGGLDFPGGEKPAMIDFAYFAFVIGMTAQTSDIAVTDRRMRRAALAHSIASFFFNTVLVAVAVNAAVGLSH